MQDFENDLDVHSARLCARRHQTNYCRQVARNAADVLCASFALREIAQVVDEVHYVCAEVDVGLLRPLALERGGKKGYPYSIQLLQDTAVQILVLLAVLDCIRSGTHLRCGIRRHLLEVRPLEVHADRKWVRHDCVTI